jgi:hypothetical protein
VRHDPSYTPDIEHLVFPDRRPGVAAKAKTARARLAGVLALTRSVARHRQQQKTSDKVSSVSIQSMIYDQWFLFTP